jgi:membrane protein DedA with SNARE-associated domain
MPRYPLRATRYPRHDLAILALLQWVVAGPHQTTILSHLHAIWAYTTLGATSILTEELAPILGGFAAHQGHLGLKRVMAAIAIGSWSAGVALYFLGRWRGSWLLRRWRGIRRPLARALRIVRRSPWRSSLFVRFAFGLRVVLPVACGAARVPLLAYLVGSGVSAVVWSVLFTLLGWAFGDAAVLIIHHVRRYEDLVAVGLIGAVVLGFAIMFRRAADREKARQAARQAQGLPAEEPTGGFPPFNDDGPID